MEPVSQRYLSVDSSKIFLERVPPRPRSSKSFLRIVERIEKLFAESQMIPFTGVSDVTISVAARAVSALWCNTDIQCGYIPRKALVPTVLPLDSKIIVDKHLQMIFLLPKKGDKDVTGTFKRGRDLYAFDLQENRESVLCAITPKSAKNLIMRKYTAQGIQMDNLVKDRISSGYAPLLREYYFSFIDRFSLPLNGDLIEKRMGIYERYTGSLKEMWDTVITRNPLKDFVNVMLPLASALAKFHEENLVLRDIKLENVLVKDQMFAFCDLDFMIDQKAKRRAQAVCGTLSYMAPEMALTWMRQRARIIEAGNVKDVDASRENVDTYLAYYETYAAHFLAVTPGIHDIRAVDVYALGCIFHKVLYGKLPFWHEQKNVLVSFKLKIDAFLQPLEPCLNGDVRAYADAFLSYVVGMMLHPYRYIRWDIQHVVEALSSLKELCENRCRQLDG